MFHILFDSGAPAREPELAREVEGGKLPPAVWVRVRNGVLPSPPLTSPLGAALHKQQVGV